MFTTYARPGNGYNVRDPFVAYAASIFTVSTAENGFQRLLSFHSQTGGGPVFVFDDAGVADVVNDDGDNDDGDSDGIIK